LRRSRSPKNAQHLGRGGSSASLGEQGPDLRCVPTENPNRSRREVRPSARAGQREVCMLGYAFYESDTRIMQYATALAKRGNTVDVIALRREANVPRGPKRRQCVPHPVENGQRTEAFGLPVRIIRFLCHAALVLSRKHLRRPYQLVHVHSVLTFWCLLPWCPNFWEHDHLGHPRCPPRAVCQQVRRGARLASVQKPDASGEVFYHLRRPHYYCNHLWYERLISRSIGRERCTAIRNYPDPDLFSPRPRDRNYARFLLTYPGTLNWHRDWTLRLGPLPGSQIRFQTLSSISTAKGRQALAYQPCERTAPQRQGRFP